MGLRHLLRSLHNRSFGVIFPIWEYPFKNMFWNKIIEDNFRILNTDREKDESGDIKNRQVATL
jgi:hypothetical protein